MSEHENPYAAWERNFREQMLRLRESRQMTQTEIARKLKALGLPFHQQTIQRIEAGERPVRLDEAHLIAQVLDVDLNTMTATGTPSVRELRYAVDRVRRSAATEAHNITETIDSWIADVEMLIYEVSERKKGLDSKQWDAATRWGMEWAIRCYEPYGHLVGGWSHLLEIAGLDESEVVRPDESMELLGVWLEHFYAGELSRLTPNELYESLSEDDNVQ